MQVPGAWLGRRFGSIKVLAISMALASVVTLLTPVTGMVQDKSAAPD